MSLFDDDFYSTKVGKERRWEKERGWSSGSRGPWRSGGRIVGRVGRLPFPRSVIAAAGGAVLTLLVLLPLLYGNAKDEGTQTAGQEAPRSEAGAAAPVDSVVVATEKVKPAVVSVLANRGDAASREGFPSGIGSGVIYATDRNKVRVVTNNHVVEQAESVEVVLADGSYKEAVVLGRDVMTDLAVLEINGEGIRTLAEFGDSYQLRSGETAIAIGNPLGLGYSLTVTKGVISSPHRVIPISLGADGIYDWELDVIQTDAAINQGNSGGPLVDIHGRVIGINSMKVSDMGVEGVGFALPINSVKPVIEELVKYGKVKRPYIGVASVELGSFAGKEGADVLKLPADVKNGIIVLEAKGPAEAAGLRTHDIITELDGQPIGSTLELRKYLYHKKHIGDKIRVTYFRSGKKDSAVVVLGEAPDPK
ncbi:S1C family serine protease [Paenibacillus turpanensis]|uniref:S1C family serine protease n=1 Tax=Paenibacillus turpanensis TaxID=2689078 RepID=UPI00140974B0|nr:trypsin-like peptidase domain-containing protein [Paenibacillus turpanensis]